MLINYKSNGKKTMREFSSIYIKTDKDKGLFSPEMCSLIGVSNDGKTVVLLTNLQRKKADKIYKRIQRQLNNPMWMGGVINV